MGIFNLNLVYGKVVNLDGYIFRLILGAIHTLSLPADTPTVHVVELLVLVPSCLVYSCWCTTYTVFQKMPLWL